MSNTTTPEPEEVTAGWLFMTANALGLSDADLAYVLDVREDTLRKNWKYGTQPIPDGVRDDMNAFVQFTDEAVELLVSRAEDIVEPAVIVFQNLRDVPKGHLAGTYGITWWDHVAFSTRRAVGPELYVGTPREVATAYDHTVRVMGGLPDVDPAVHEDPSVLAIYSSVQRTRTGR